MRFQAYPINAGEHYLFSVGIKEYDPEATARIKAKIDEAMNAVAYRPNEARFLAQGYSLADIEKYYKMRWDTIVTVEPSERETGGDTLGELGFESYIVFALLDSGDDENDDDELEKIQAEIANALGFLRPTDAAPVAVVVLQNCTVDRQVQKGYSTMQILW